MHHLHSLHHSTSCNKLGRIVVQVLRNIVQMMERRMMGRWRRLMVMKTITQPPTIN